MFQTANQIWFIYYFILGLNSVGLYTMEKIMGPVSEN